MIDDRLDTWLPEPAVRTWHRRSAVAGAEDLWRCARSVRLCDTRTLGRLVRWRIPGTPAGIRPHSPEIEKRSPSSSSVKG